MPVVDATEIFGSNLYKEPLVVISISSIGPKTLLELVVYLICDSLVYPTLSGVFPKKKLNVLSVVEVIE